MYLWVYVRISIYLWKYVCVVFWPSTRPKMPFNVMHRKEVTHSNGNYERKSRGRKLANKMELANKSHGTLIDWRTGREWPVNCMTVISAWCHSKDRVGDWVGVELLYHSVKTEVRQLQLEFGRSYRRVVVRKATPGQRGSGPRLSWDPEKLLIRCSKESHHPAESWAAGPPVEHLENEKDTTLTAIRVGVNILQFCSVSTSLSHANPE